MKLSDYIQLDGLRMAEGLKSGEFKPEEIFESSYRLYEKINPNLNAIVTSLYSDYMNQLKLRNPRSPFWGVPFLLKDLAHHFPPIKTSMGSRLMRNYIPNQKSTSVERFEKSGLVFVGKSNVPELGIMGVTESELWGPCRNPWNTQLTSGGSSGGSAAAVAARIVPIAAADDGGGSIRIPASACGLFGFKPTRGVNPLGPDKTESWLGLVSGHVVSRSVRDSAALLDFTKGEFGGPYFGPQLPETFSFRIGKKKIGYQFQSMLGKNVEKECLIAQQEALNICKQLGHWVEEAPLTIEKELVSFAYLVIVAASVSGDVSRCEKTLGRKSKWNEIELATQFLNQVGKKLSARLLEWALFECRQYSYRMHQYHEKYDFFCSPTMTYRPSEIGLMQLSFFDKLGAYLSPYLPSGVLEKALRDMADKGMEKTPNTMLFNLTGQPAMSVPIFWTQEKVPIGVQFAAAMGKDAELMGLAFEIEKEVQWQKQIPNIVSDVLI